MMAPKLRFLRGLKAKAPGAVTACVPALTLLVEIFTGPSTEHKKQRWSMWGFFFTFEGLSSVWLLFYQSFDTGLLLWSSPDSWLAMLHSRRCLYIRSDDPSMKARQAFTVSWNMEVFVHISSVVIFPPGAPVTSFLSQPISTVIRRRCFQHDETSSLLDRRPHESHQTYSSYQLVSHLGTSTTLFPAIWTKTARSIEELFSQWKRPKRASSDQRTDEEVTSIGDMQQQPRWWPGFDRCVETRLRLDVYIRPWPPGWSFLRRIYTCTSRGSERVKYTGRVFNFQFLLRL